MKTFVFPLLAIASLASAHGQTAKPGTISPVLVEATIITDNAPTTSDVRGGVRKIYTTNSVRFINRDILEAMRTANLLDGTLTGWMIQRLANPSGVGNVYATKPGRTAVPVPATLLTQPVAVGSATTGTEFTPTGGATKPTLFRRVHATLNVKNGPSTAFGTQTVKSANFKAGSSLTPVLTITENYNLTGKSGTGTGVLVGSYRVTKAKPADLSALLPGNTVP